MGRQKKHNPLKQKEHKTIPVKKETAEKLSEDFLRGLVRTERVPSALKEELRRQLEKKKTDARRKVDSYSQRMAKIKDTVPDAPTIAHFAQESRDFQHFSKTLKVTKIPFTKKDVNAAHQYLKLQAAIASVSRNLAVQAKNKKYWDPIISELNFAAGLVEELLKSIGK
jgi:hypothetical protein